MSTQTKLAIIGLLLTNLVILLGASFSMGARITGIEKDVSFTKEYVVDNKTIIKELSKDISELNIRVSKVELKK